MNKKRPIFLEAPTNFIDLFSQYLSLLKCLNILKKYGSNNLIIQEYNEKNYKIKKDGILYRSVYNQSQDPSINLKLSIFGNCDYYDENSNLIIPKILVKDSITLEIKRIKMFLEDMSSSIQNHIEIDNSLEDIVKIYSEYLTSAKIDISKFIKLNNDEKE